MKPEWTESLKLALTRLIVPNCQDKGWLVWEMAKEGVSLSPL